MTQTTKVKEEGLGSMHRSRHSVGVMGMNIAGAGGFASGFGFAIATTFTFTSFLQTRSLVFGSCGSVTYGSYSSLGATVGGIKQYWDGLLAV